MSSAPLLIVNKVRKVYTKGRINRRLVFQLNADFAIQEPTIVGIIGPNGAGKTTLLELISGEIKPTEGEIFCCSQNIQNVKFRERKYLVKHHYPPNQFFRANQKFLTKMLPVNLFRRFKRFLNSFLSESAERSERMIHLYDELNLEDGYCDFLIDFFLGLRRKGHLVVFCFHPTKPLHLEIMRKICGQYIFVHDGALTQLPDFETLLADERVRNYLGFDNDTIKSLSSAPDIVAV